MTIDDQVARVARALVAQTSASMLNWKTTDDSAAFLVTVPTGSALIKSADDEGRYPYSLTLISAEGNPLATLLASESYDSPWDEVLADLYAVARANALGIDSFVTSFLQDIGAPPDPGSSSSTDAPF